jgi:NADH-quinone oxidoreductase subunit N
MANVMSLSDLHILLPLVIVAASAVAAMLAIAVRRSHAATAGIALGGLAAAAFAALLALICHHRSMVPLWSSMRLRYSLLDPPIVGHIMLIDTFALSVIALVLLASFVVGVLSYGYLSRCRERPEEYYVLLLLATLGASVLAMSVHFAMFFLGLEVLSVALYGLVTYERGPLGVEAGMKYLVLGGAASAFVLFGMALVYFESGSMGIFGGWHNPGNYIELAGWAMLLVGVGFKLAVVPFHLWTADVYQGAPAPVTALVATVSKGAVLLFLLRWTSLWIIPSRLGPFFWFLAAVAVASMFTGNLLALQQRNVKRLLAYSSISHMGYLLITVLVGGAAGVAAVGFYLVTYFAATLGAFGVVTALSGSKGEAETMEDYRGLAWRQPALAALMTAALLSLAGIPLTAGFVGKFYLLTAGAGAGLWALVIILVANSGIGLFYYLRVVWAMFGQPAEQAAEAPRIGLATGIVLAGLGAAVVALGVWPGPLVELVRAWMGGG